MDHVSHVSCMPVEFLNDKQIVDEFDKLLLVLVELDKSKLPAIREEAYQILLANLAVVKFSEIGEVKT